MNGPDQIARLAALGNALRPDWPVASLQTFIERNLSARAYGDVAVALAWVGSRCPETATPRLLLESGPWWKAAVLDDPQRAHRHPPKPHEECGKHPGQYRLSCGGCAADRREIREQREAEQAEEARMRREEAIRKAREDAAAAKAARTTEEDE